jgi:hypothetical protein
VAVLSIKHIVAVLVFWFRNSFQFRREDERRVDNPSQAIQWLVPMLACKDIA